MSDLRSVILAFIAAAQRHVGKERDAHGVTHYDYDDLFVALQAGWKSYDGGEIRDADMVALAPDAARAYLLDGKAWGEGDIIQRFPAKPPPESSEPT